MDARLSHHDITAALTGRLLSHPPGLLAHGARMGCALHTETHAVLDLVAHDPDRPWSAPFAQQGDAQAQPFGPLGNQPWRPSRFARTAKLAFQAPLKIDTLPGMPLRHRKGGLYTGVAIAQVEQAYLAIYADAQGAWWARPWALFCDGRFTPEPPQRVAWRDLLVPAA